MHAVLRFYLNKIPRRFIVNKINLFTKIIIFKQTNWKISAATLAKQTLIIIIYSLTQAQKCDPYSNNAKKIYIL